MPDLLAHALATGSSLSLCAGIVWFTVRGPLWRERLWTRAHEHAVTRIQSRRRARIERGSTSRRTLRALHNDFDPACDYWFGDRRPEANDTTNRDFGGASTSTTDRRCLVCRPFTDAEDQHLTTPDLPYLPGLTGLPVLAVLPGSPAAGMSVRGETMTP